MFFHGKLILGYPFFFGNTPIIYTKIIPKLQNLKSWSIFGGWIFPYNHPLEWPIIGRNFSWWGQETPRPPARVPMRYTKRSWNLMKSSDRRNCKRWKPEILVILVVCLGRSFWAGRCFLLSLPFLMWTSRKKPVKQSRSCKEQDLLVNLPGIFIVLLCVFSGQVTNFNEIQTKILEKPNGGGQ